MARFTHPDAEKFTEGTHAVIIGTHFQGGPTVVHHHIVVTGHTATRINAVTVGDKPEKRSFSKTHMTEIGGGGTIKMRGGQEHIWARIADCYRRARAVMGSVDYDMKRAVVMKDKYSTDVDATIRAQIKIMREAADQAERYIDKARTIRERADQQKEAAK